MHYVSKESRNKELIWIRKVTSKEEKKNIKWKKRTKCLLANFKKRDFIQKENWVFLESADRLFLNKRRNASSI